MLRVIQAFGGHAIGDEITDVAEIATIVDSEQVSFVVTVADPEPETKSSSTKSNA